MVRSLLREAAKRAFLAPGGGPFEGGWGNSDQDWGAGGAQGYIPEFEGVGEGYDAIDPLARELEPGASVPMNQELRNAATTEATQTCQDCPVCGFMVDGKYVTAAYPVPWAMDYQDRVVRLVARGNLPFDMEPDASRIQEWQLPHATSGDDPGSGTRVRSIDGFALMPCMLIEAKLGYGDYLIEKFSMRTDRSRPADITSTMPETDRGNPNADRRMNIFRTQMVNHNNLARRYPRTSAPTQHTVVWCCSNQKTALFCGGTALQMGLERIRAFHVPTGMLPPSRWITK